MKKSVRLLELQRLLRDRPRTVAELARVLGCSTYTIGRDLADLREWPGLAVEQDAAGRWRIGGRWTRPHYGMADNGRK